jgi:hypothetical protein
VRWHLRVDRDGAVLERLVVGLEAKPCRSAACVKWNETRRGEHPHARSVISGNLRACVDGRREGRVLGRVCGGEGLGVLVGRACGERGAVGGRRGEHWHARRAGVSTCMQGNRALGVPNLGRSYVGTRGWSRLAWLQSACNQHAISMQSARTLELAAGRGLLGCVHVPLELPNLMRDAISRTQHALRDAIRGHQRPSPSSSCEPLPRHPGPVVTPPSGASSPAQSPPRGAISGN